MKTIVFSHANSFPAGTYRQLFEAWREAGYTVHAVEKFGHDPRFPVSVNWPNLRDQLIHFIEQTVGGPVWLVGHSLGGYLSLMTAARRPELARGVVLLDSPILPEWKARMVQVARVAGIGKRFMPGGAAKRRRQQWDSADAAHAHFAAKPNFARWAPGVLDDYIAAGTAADDSGGRQRRLAFDREVESAIYETLPHHLMRLLRRRPLQCGLAMVAGRDSVEVRQVGLAATERIAHGRLSLLDGSHLFPFEHPRETAAEVLRWIAALPQGSPTPRL